VKTLRCISRCSITRLDLPEKVLLDRADIGHPKYKPFLKYVPFQLYNVGHRHYRKRSFGVSDLGNENHIEFEKKYLLLFFDYVG
jgi:hypothetical protein